jgi:hypothetical protein
VVTVALISFAVPSSTCDTFGSVVAVPVVVVVAKNLVQGMLARKRCGQPE